MNIVIATRSCYEHGPTPQRMDIFRRVTVPSLLAQTDPQFTWIINASNEEHSDWIESITGTMDVRFVKKFSVEEVPDVRMVRLDDDDALAVDFIERLRKKKHRGGDWHVFPVGFRTYRGGADRKVHPTNQFCALDVPTGSQRHVYELNHLRVEGAKIVDQAPAWLWTRHSESTSVGGRSPAKLPITALAPYFGISLPFLARLR